jgi:ParB family chromosome partitioning protein
MSTARSLGKGLSALLGEADIARMSQAAGGDIRELAVTEIRNYAGQPRKNFSEKSLAELSQSILENGVLQPILVRPAASGGGYEIIAGERRWRAAQLAGLAVVPVVVKEVATDAAYVMALIENIQREDLNPVEEAEGYQQLLEQLQMTQEQLAQRLGKSRSHVTNMLRLLQHGEVVLQYLRQGLLSTGHAKVLLGLDHTEELASRIIAEGWSVRDTERYVQQLAKRVNEHTRQEPLKERASNKDADLVHLEGMMTESLGMRVEIQELPEGGKVVIYFKTLEQLDAVLQKIGANMALAS